LKDNVKHTLNRVRKLWTWNTRKTTLWVNLWIISLTHQH